MNEEKYGTGDSLRATTKAPLSTVGNMVQTEK